MISTSASMIIAIKLTVTNFEHPSCYFFTSCKRETEIPNLIGLYFKHLVPPFQKRTLQRISSGPSSQVYTTAILSYRMQENIKFINDWSASKYMTSYKV